MTLVLLLACAAEVDPVRMDDVLALEGDPVAGEAIYEERCQECHGPSGDGQGSGPPLSGLSEEEVLEAVLAGPCFMPSYADDLSDQELADVTAYVASL